MELPKPRIPNFREMTWADWKKLAKGKKKELYIGAAISAAIIAAFFIGLKSIAIVTALIAFGLGSSLFVRYSGFYLGNDFTLFGAIVGSYLFGPWVGALIVAAIYMILPFFPSDEGIDYPVGLWFAMTVFFIMPKLPLDSYPMMKLLLATAIGEAGNALYWSMRGFPLPWQVLMGIAKMLWYWILFVSLLPAMAAFVG